MTRAHNEPLTPDRVRSATFSASRLGRRGLDEAEVRGFCERVSDGLGQLLHDNSMLQEEVMRLRDRLLKDKGRSGVHPEDGHVHAVYVLSKAQQTADRYVAEAQEYSRELTEDARARREEILREAKTRASMILEDAHKSATHAAETARDNPDPLPAAERQELQAEIAYLRTFSDVCRTHLHAYLESLTHSLEDWERAERSGALTSKPSAKPSANHSPQHVGLSRSVVTAVRGTVTGLRARSRLHELTSPGGWRLGYAGVMPRSPRAPRPGVCSGTALTREWAAMTR